MVGVDEVTDSRFKVQHADPRFQSVPKSKRKVKVDDRFKAMLDTNSSFGRKSITDKYGRKVKHEIKEDLGQFYDIDDEEEEKEKVQKKSGKEGKSKAGVKEKVKDGKKAKKGAELKTSKKKKSKVDDDEDEDEDEDEEPAQNKKKGPGSFDQISAKLKHQDLRSAMLDWASSSSDDEEDQDVSSR
eukprot:1682832-Rhodomonas_salina.1